MKKILVSLITLGALSLSTQVKSQVILEALEGDVNIDALLGGGGSPSSSAQESECKRLGYTWMPAYTDGVNGTRATCICPSESMYREAKWTSQNTWTCWNIPDNPTPIEEPDKPCGDGRPDCDNQRE